ncbi:uncharacterized protein (DUF58 family) [Peribacillus deserti]|uniref:Uncharacterized protein (DUF58 family) n=1 Tax=Peribacillus deserti TaxID=673318 RepID=A0ABS2QKR8_9BACI|nr:DUF58 domain-containing protein [Peribacillus deserti]MBM7693359.1 uncharacterized protein (DUF58 family) [Peribacillus deserti]
MKLRPMIETVYPFQAGFIASTVPAALVIVLFYPAKYLLFILAVYYLYAVFLKLHNSYIVESVRISDKIKRVRVFPGEKAQLEFGLLNNGKLPVVQAKLNFSLDKSMTVSQKNQDVKSDFNLISQYISLPPKKSVSWEIEVIPQKRGIYHIKELELILYDWFNTSSIHYPAMKRLKHEILVYPELKPVAGIEELFKITQGSASANFSLYRDELSISGVKPYEGEGFRQIHWKATARSGELIAKRFQPVIQKGFTICLYLTAEKSFSYHPHMEEYISYTAFVCKYLSERRIPYELFINLNAQNEPIQLHLNEGDPHFSLCLETLAQLSEEGQLLTADYFNRFVKSHRFSNNITVWIGEAAANVQTGFVRTINKDGIIQGGEKRALSIG